MYFKPLVLKQGSLANFQYECRATVRTQTHSGAQKFVFPAAFTKIASLLNCYILFLSNVLSLISLSLSLPPSLSLSLSIFNSNKCYRLLTIKKVA